MPGLCLQFCNNEDTVISLSLIRISLLMIFLPTSGVSGANEKVIYYAVFYAMQQSLGNTAKFSFLEIILIFFLFKAMPLHLYT